MSNKIPNLFIAGAPKCGTTSLYFYLEQHKEIFFSEPKELNYFSNEEIKSQGLYYNDYIVKTEEEYLKIFRKAANEHKIIGEASVSYFFYPSVPKKIFNFNPNAKIVIILRDPVKRAWSHYLMDKRLGLVNKDFMDVFYSEDESDKLYYQQYFLLGNYYTQVSRYFEYFDRKNIHILFTDDLKKDGQKELDKIFDFLEIERLVISDVAQYNSYRDAKFGFLKRLYKNKLLRKTASALLPAQTKNNFLSRFFIAKPPRLDSNVERILREYYLQEIKGLESLLNCDLSSWK